MRALITGAGGFAGAHLRRHLRECGDAVGGWVRTEPTEAGDRQLSDVRDRGEVAAALAADAPEVVYHLAGLTHVGSSFSEREATFDVNLAGAVAVLEGVLAMAARPRVVLVSSSEAYGLAATVADCLQETDPLRPVSPYGLSKAAQELLGREYATRAGLDVVIVRSFNHTGPGQTPRFVVADWSKQVAEIERGLRPPRLVVGNLDVVKDFSDVRDIVRLYRAAATEGRSGEVYNGCSGQPVPLRQIVDQLQTLSKVRFEVEVDPARLRPVEVPRAVGANAKAGKDLAWKPKFTLAQTIADTLEYWRAETAAAR